MLQALDRITFNPQIMARQACVRGRLILVSFIVNLVANGKPNEEILEEYPDLELEDIQQALQYSKNKFGTILRRFSDHCNY